MYLAKGSKFVPDTKHHHMRDVVSSVQGLRRQLHLGYFWHERSSTSTAPRRKCTLKSLWEPPHQPDVDTAIDSMLREALDYQPATHHVNYDCDDSRAVGWLKRHSDILAVADCDKGLGDAIFSRSWLDQMSEKHLSEACVELPRAAFDHDNGVAKAGASHLLDNALQRHVITYKQFQFLAQKLSSPSAGTFRLRPKIHKTPHQARPVFNMTPSWMYPCAVFLCEMLAPIVDAVGSHVLQSSDHLPQNWLCRSGLEVDGV